MKKTLCMSLALCVALLCCCAALAACKPDPMKTAVQNGDNYTIVCSYDAETHVLSAVQTLKMTNRSENCFDEVKLHIYANQYREDAATSVVPNAYRSKAYPNGASYGEISFDSVKVNGVPVAFTVGGQDCDILSVPIDGGLFPDKGAELELTYQVQLANAHHRLGYNDNTVNFGNWYPVLCHVDNGNYTESPYYNVGDPFVSDVANYDVSFTLPEGYLAAATGELTEATSEGGSVTYRYRADAVRDFALVASDKFTKITDTVGDTQVNYYYYADKDAESSLAAACGMMKFLNEKVGKYPYSQYSVAETEFCYGGMEYPNLAMVASGGNSYREAVAHETAHQWFYGVVGNDQITDAWQDEGLAEYLTYLYLDETGAMRDRLYSDLRYLRGRTRPLLRKRGAHDAPDRRLQKRQRIRCVYLRERKPDVQHALRDGRRGEILEGAMQLLRERAIFRCAVRAVDTVLCPNVRRRSGKHIYELHRWKRSDRQSDGLTRRGRHTDKSRCCKTAGFVLQ